MQLYSSKCKYIVIKPAGGFLFYPPKPQLQVVVADWQPVVSAVLDVLA